MDGQVDHYVVLGLPSGEKGAKLSEDEIKKAYRSKVLESHPDKRPDDPNAHRNFLNLQTSYKILMDKDARQSFHQHEEEKMINRMMRRKSQQNSSSKRRRKSAVDEREQAARAASSAAQAARDTEDQIRRNNDELIARIRRQAAAKAPPPAAASSTLNNKGGAIEAPASTQCPCRYCQGCHRLDRELSSNFEAHQNSFEFYDISNS